MTQPSEMMGSVGTKSASLAGLDYGKFIAALFVITIHTSPLYGISRHLNYLLIHGFSRIAVPFFFLCSGYFYARKAAKSGWSWDVLAAFVRRIFLVYGVWSLIYFMVAYREQKPASWVEFTSEFIRAFLINGSYYHFWYFPALLSSILTLHVLRRFLPLHVILIIGALAYGFCLAGDLYWKAGRLPGLRVAIDWWIRHFSHTRNLMLNGLIFVALGAFAAQSPSALSFGRCAAASSAFVLLYLAECFFAQYFGLANDRNAGIFLVPASYFLFLTAMKWRPREWVKPELLRNLSIVVYCVHPLFIFFLGMTGAAIPALLIYFMVVILSIGFGLMIVKTKFKPFQWLY